MANPIDLTGQKFGKLAVIKPSHSYKGRWWLCQCDCGTIRSYSAYSLRDGSSQSCGCARLKDLTGKRFGRLTVISRAPNDKNKNTMWNCQCDCGNKSIVQGGTLKLSKVVSCGCFMRETNTTHGVSKHPLFGVWRMMISRCYDEKDPAYKNYGGRGIYVCEEWINNPSKFISDMPPRTEGLTLDRIDNDKGYSKENCKWSDREEQAKNRRSTRLITFNGQTNSILCWSRITGIKGRTITERLNRNWPIEIALTKKP